jgi:hypothetical protein
VRLRADPRKQRGRPPRSGARLTRDPRDRPIGGPTSPQLGPSSQRLIDLLDRPMRGRELARELGLSRERVRQLLLDLHAQGRIAFADPDHPSWLVRRVDDETALLSREEERVLSALPRRQATDARGLSVAAKLSDVEVQPIIENLVVAGLAEVCERLWGVREFRITAAGLNHPQYVPTARQAPPPPLPVRSDRVRSVLQAHGVGGDRKEMPRPCMGLRVKGRSRAGLRAPPFLCSSEERFFVPSTGVGPRRGQPRSSLTEGHRRRRRAAGLTAASTARGSPVRDEEGAAGVGRT